MYNVFVDGIKLPLKLHPVRGCLLILGNLFTENIIFLVISMRSESRSELEMEIKLHQLQSEQNFFESVRVIRIV